jgi:hypothetical protein
MNSVSSEKPPRGAKPRIELGPASRKADALPPELRYTLLSYTAPYWAHTHYHYYHIRYPHPTPASVSLNPHKARKLLYGGFFSDPKSLRLVFYLLDRKTLSLVLIRPAISWKNKHYMGCYGGDSVMPVRYVRPCLFPAFFPGTIKYKYSWGYYTYNVIPRAFMFDDLNMFQTFTYIISPNESFTVIVEWCKTYNFLCKFCSQKFISEPFYIYNKLKGHGNEPDFPRFLH